MIQMNRHIIFTGPDRSGKTTTAKLFAKRNGMQYFKNEAEQKLAGGDFTEYFRATAPFMLGLMEQTDWAGSGLVMDRFTPCEFAYSFAFGRKTDQDLLLRIDQRLAELGVVHIIMYRTDYGEHDWTAEWHDGSAVDRIIEGYRQYAQMSSMQTIAVDTTGAKVTDVLNSLEGALF